MEVYKETSHNDWLDHSVVLGVSYEVYRLNNRSGEASDGNVFYLNFGLKFSDYTSSKCCCVVRCAYRSG